MKQVIDFDKSRQIASRREAEKTTDLLISRGKQNHIKGLERLHNHVQHDSAIGQFNR